MESYFKTKQQEKKTLNVKADSFVPQLPALQTHVPSLPKHDVINPQTPIITTTERTVTQIQSLTTAPFTLQSSIRNPVEHAPVTSPDTLPVSSKNEQNNIYSVMEKQNEIIALLIQQQCLSSMPKKENQVFDGEPLQCQSFIKSLEHNIESKSHNPLSLLSGAIHKRTAKGNCEKLSAYGLRQRIHKSQVLTAGAFWQ